MVRHEGLVKAYLVIKIGAKAGENYQAIAIAIALMYKIRLFPTDTSYGFWGPGKGPAP